MVDSNVSRTSTPVTEMWLNVHVLYTHLFLSVPHSLAKIFGAQNEPDSAVSSLSLYTTSVNTGVITLPVF